MRRLTCDSDVELIGQTVQAYLDNMESENIQPILEKHDLLNIQPDQWYSAQQFLNVLNELSERSNMSSSFVAIGMAVVEKMVVPPELEAASLGEVLAGWNNLYQIQHRGGEIGYIVVEKISDTHYKTIHRNIYPDDMSYGVAYGLARRWLPKGTPFTVKYDEHEKRMDNGGVETIIHLQW